MIEKTRQGKKKCIGERKKGLMERDTKEAELFCVKIKKKKKVGIRYKTRVIKFDYRKTGE